MSVMQIWVMRVLVPDRFVAMKMGMRFGRVPNMGMIVMLVVHMKMVMFKFFVNMLMFVPFRKMKPKSDCHQ